MAYRAPRVKPRYPRRYIDPSVKGYTWAWRKASKAYLVSNPYCVTCGHMSEVVDHITPHRGNDVLFWDTSNWQALCNTCHNHKTGQGS